MAKSETRNFFRKEERLTIDNDMSMAAYVACRYFYAPDVETLPRDNNNVAKYTFQNIIALISGYLFLWQSMQIRFDIPA